MQTNIIYNSDCLLGMSKLPDSSIDLIITDLPYGTSASSWDRRLPMNELWVQYERIIKKNRAIVLFAQQPFTSLLITSNLKMYKYNWIWEKENSTNFLNSHFQPLKITEDICVFGTGATSNSKNDNMLYNPQFMEGTPYKGKQGKHKGDSSVIRGKSRENSSNILTENNGKRYPKNIIKFGRDSEKLHPTQKPVALIEYLIKTYSNEGDIVLDSCIGSGTTAVAAINTNRKYIGFETSKEYFDIAIERIKNCTPLPHHPYTSS